MLRVLISGAGIAGLTLADRLAAAGHRPLIVESAPGPRTGGYMIDFFGPGFGVAEKLDLLPELERIHYPVSRLVFVGEHGDERISLDYPTMRRRLFDDRHFNFMRGDLERVLYSRVCPRVEIRHSTTIARLRPRVDGISVCLSNGENEDFDVAVGADGVHSRTRSLMFVGADFERYLGYCAAAFTLKECPDGIAPDAFTTWSVPGRQVAVYPTRNRGTAVFLVFAETDPVRAMAAPHDTLARRFARDQWIVPQLIRAIPTGSDLYFDIVSQIEMRAWHMGRVGLVGDAAYCVSLLAGQGASLAMAGASVLAEELHRTPAHAPQAFDRYHARVAAATLRRQAAGRGIAKWFVPSSRLRMAARAVLMRTLLLKPVASIVKRRSALERVAL